MFRSRIAKSTVAGFAAAAGLILLVSSVGAHQTRLFAREGLTLSTSTASSAREGENDAAEDAAAVAAEAQKEAAEKAAEQADEAQDETGDVETETGDNETDETATDETGPEDTTQAAGTHNDSGDNKGESHSGD